MTRRTGRSPAQGVRIGSSLGPGHRGKGGRFPIGIRRYVPRSPEMVARAGDW